MKKLISVLFVALLFAVNLMACPNCNEGFAAGTANASIGEAYSISVLFMLAVPLTIVTAFAVVISKKLKANGNNQQ